MTWENTTAILLAGGIARRMGRDKRFMEMDGEALIRSKVKQLEAQFSHVIISANDPEKLQFLNHPVVVDEWPDKGPVGGIASCLKQVETEWMFVTAVDIPTLDLHILKAMWEVRNDWDIVIPRESQGYLEPLYAFYNRKVLIDLERAVAADELALHTVISKLNHRVVDLPPGVHIPNLNDPEDYRLYEESTRG